MEEKLTEQQVINIVQNALESVTVRGPRNAKLLSVSYDTLQTYSAQDSAVSRMTNLDYVINHLNKMEVSDAANWTELSTVMGYLMALRRAVKAVFDTEIQKQMDHASQKTSVDEGPMVTKEVPEDDSN